MVLKVATLQKQNDTCSHQTHSMGSKYANDAFSAEAVPQTPLQTVQLDFSGLFRGVLKEGKSKEAVKGS